MAGRLTLAAAAALAVGLAASGTWAQTPPPMSATDYLHAAANSDTFEITEARVVAIAGQTPQVKAFARRMIEDHTRTDEALKAAAAASGLPPPPKSLSGDQAKMLASLQSLKGPRFDTTYATQQVDAHVAALVVEQGYARNGSDANLRQAARAAVPIIQHHLQMARQLKATVGAT